MKTVEKLMIFEQVICMDDNRISPDYFKKHMEWRCYNSYKVYEDKGYDYIIPQELATHEFYNPFELIDKETNKVDETVKHELIADILRGVHDISFVLDEKYRGVLSQIYFSINSKEKAKIHNAIIEFTNKYGLLGLIHDYSYNINFLNEPPMSLKEFKKLFRTDKRTNNDDSEQASSFTASIMHFGLDDDYFNNHRLKGYVRVAGQEEFIDEMIESRLKPEHFYPSVIDFDYNKPVNDHSKYAEPVHIFLKACDEIYMFFKYYRYYRDHNLSPQDKFEPLFGEKVFTFAEIKEIYTWEDYFGLFYPNKCHVRSVFENGRWQIKYMPDTLYSAICLYSMLYTTTKEQIVIACSNCERISIVGSKQARYCSTVCREAKSTRESHRRKAKAKRDDSYTSEIIEKSRLSIPDKIIDEAGLLQSDKIS